MRPLPGRDTALLSLVVVTLFPLVGVVWFGWTAQTVVVLYWLEIGIGLLRGAVEGLFAQLPPTTENDNKIHRDRLSEKRGSIVVVDWLPPVYPRNVPEIAGHLWILGLFWPIAGLFALGDHIAALSGGAIETLAIGVVLAFGREAAGVYTSVRDGDYEDLSAESTVARHHIGGLLLLSYVAPVLLSATPTTGLGYALTLVVLLGTKLCYDLADEQLTSVGRFLHEKLPERVGERPPVPTPDGDPLAVVETDGRSTAAQGILKCIAAVLPLGLIALVAFDATGGPEVGAPGVALGVLVLVALVGWVGSRVGHLIAGSVEYRVYADGILGYDTRLDEPQWFVPYEDVEDVVTRHEDTKRYVPTGFGRVRFDLPSDERPGHEQRILDHLADADELAETIEWARNYDSWEAAGCTSTDEASASQPRDEASDAV
ncbi:DUF6498-containing protein [Haloarchaeobius sp. DFWS5]|uniref:DUF6498-containing protein n=1 Tax=Haloarchaeobius sp. DFWS5 TaxID=3446114 RepID=UPI003EBD13FC